MKKQLLLVIIFLGILNISFSQIMPSNSLGEVEYTDVVNLDSSKTKQALYNKAMEWIAFSFKSAKNVLQLTDKESGVIILKGVIEIDPTGSGMSGTIHRNHAGFVEFTLTLKFKDGKYKYSFKNLNHKATYSGGDMVNKSPDCGKWKMTDDTRRTIKRQADKKILNTIANLDSFMKKKSSNNSNEDDW